MALKNKKTQQKNYWLRSLLISFALVLNSCATAVPNVPVCVEINLMRARCVKIISGEQFSIDDWHPYNGKTWWDMRPTVVQMPAGSWSEIKKFIIKICKKTNKCQEEVASWDRSVKAIDDTIAQKPGGKL